MIAKKYIEKWLLDFIGVMCELSGDTFALDVRTGRGVLCVPPDIFTMLKARKIVEFWDGSFILTFQTNGMGDAVVRVIADPDLKTGLVLRIPDAEK